MTITYRGGNGLFDDLGEFIICVNQFRDVATGENSPVPDLPARLDALESQLGGSNRHDILSGIPEQFSGFKDGIVSWARILSDKATSRLTHKETVLDELVGLGNNVNVQNVLAELYRQMVADGETLNKTEIVIGTAASFDGADVTTADDEITVTAHGFGPTGAEVAVRYDEDASGTIGGLTDGDVYTAEVIDANTVEILDADLSSGTGTNHELVPLVATATDGNNGNGKAWHGIQLDGVTSPGAGILPNREYAGEDSELAVGESMGLTCISDEDSDGRAIGEEVFQWQSRVGPNGGGLGWDTESSGTSRSVVVLNGYHIVSNKDFESWDANVPSNWTLDHGSPGLHVIQKNAAVDVFRGDSSLEIKGETGQATIQISQTLPSRILTPQRLYMLSVRVKGNASVTSGTLTIQFESPSGEYVAAASEKVELDATALSEQTAYGEERFYLLAPEEIPDDLELVIKTTGTLDDGVSIHVDSLAFGPIEFGNGINVAITAGSDQFVRGDRFTFTVHNDGSATFQEFFRRKYRVQLPSDGAGAETIADSLAKV